MPGMCRTQIGFFLARGRSRPPTTLTDRFHLAQPQLRHWRQPRLRSSRPRRLLSSRRSHQDSGPQPIRRARTRRRRTSIEALAPRPRKSMASARNPACTKTSACFCQLSLVKRPPCTSTTPRSPLPYTSAETTPPSSVGNVMCSWARADTGNQRPQAVHRGARRCERRRSAPAQDSCELRKGGGPERVDHPRWLGTRSVSICDKPGRPPDARDPAIPFGTVTLIDGFAWSVVMPKHRECRHR